MRIIYTTMQAPFSKSEPFITNELLELQRQGHDLLVTPLTIPDKTKYPIHPSLQSSTVVKELWSPEVLATALKVWSRNKRARAIVLRVLASDRTPRVFLRNLCVLPKALWLSEQAVRWKADHIHAHWIHMSATAAMVASEISGIPFSITAHRGDIIDNNLLDIKVEKALFIRFISDYSQNAFLERVPQADQSHLVRINMGVLIPEELPVVQFANPVRIACPAHFIPRKSQETLVRATHILSKIGMKLNLFFAGDGPDLPMCQSLCRDLGIDAQFSGVIPNSRLLGMYRQRLIDIMALPSLAEGIPVSLMEAMAYGIPVVATAVDGVPELLSGDCGLMVPPLQPQALADALRSLIDQPERTAQMVINARRKVETEFNQPLIVKRLVELMRQANQH